MKGVLFVERDHHSGADDVAGPIDSFTAHCILYGLFARFADQSKYILPCAKSCY